MTISIYNKTHNSNNKRGIKMSEKIKVGIVGCGFVGGALKAWLDENNPEGCEVFVSDPAKGYNDDLSNIDIAFLQIHVPTQDDGTQDLTLMKDLIRNLPDVPIFVRTTILPGTSEMLTKETGHQVYFMPEFLTERTHIEDFKTQPMVFTGAIELLCKIFKGKTFTTMTPLEAEITKYAHNVFGAYKVTYFNAVNEYCKKMGADWSRVHAGMLLSGYINDTHTYVPGPDGKYGYGGKCFPKDVNAFAKLTEDSSLGRLLSPLHELNVHFRGFEEKI
jgi:UDPglucose 6-dehydrogenase